MKLKPFSLILLSTLIAFGALTGCGSTRTENGVTIQKQANYNPLSYIPGL